MADVMRGLRLQVYRTHAHGGGDCTNGGVTAKAHQLTLVGIVDESDRTVIVPLSPESRVCEPTAQAPAVVLLKRAQLGDVLRPADQLQRWSMMGGNYAATSDSRFNALVDFYGALPVHDRFE